MRLVRSARYMLQLEELSLLFVCYLVRGCAPEAIIQLLNQLRFLLGEREVFIAVYLLFSKGLCARGNHPTTKSNKVFAWREREGDG